MQMRRWMFGSVLLSALTIVGCDCGGETLKQVQNTKVVINAPVDGDTVATTVTFDATATSAAGLTQLDLHVGPKSLQICQPAGDDTTLNCVTTVTNLSTLLDQQDKGTLTFTATATDQNGVVVDASVKVLLVPITVSFVRPSARLPNVKGTSNLELKVDSLLGVERVIVTADAETSPFASWLVPPWTQQVAWASTVGTGQHKLKAQARDVNGAVASAEVTVNVACTGDEDCVTGQRCCVTSGKCNPIVGPGADCDCDHPCPTDQGCFPGTCNLQPRKCRPGCFPGGERRGQYATACAPERQGNLTVPAYCNNLPPEEATSENQGGACAPTDDCSIQAQNCPDMPLDRNRPPAADNPVVKYSCVPVSPKANTCLPAGNLPLHSTGCEYNTCGNAAVGCQKGLICVGLVDQDGNRIGASTCERQCSRDGTLNCSTSETCGTLLSPGLEEFPTGTCQSGFGGGGQSCQTDADCPSGICFLGVCF